MLSDATEWQRLHVQQSPRDLLVLSAAAREPEARAVGGGHGVEAWQDEHGEVYFKDSSSGPTHYAITPYGLYMPSHLSDASYTPPPDTSRVARLKRDVVKFLWGLMEDLSWGMRDLFRHFGAKIHPPLTPHWSIECIDFESFREFVSRSGFRSDRPPQDWYAVFHSIEELSIAPVGGIAFNALRTVLLDPFHMGFWRQYTRRVLTTGRTVTSIVAVLLRQLSPNLPEARLPAEADGQEPTVVPWVEFLDCLARFHTALGVPEPSSAGRCRLLYRFDLSGQGEIHVSSFVRLLQKDLFALCDAAEPPSVISTEGRLNTQTTAVLNSRGRPDVEVYTTARAVRRLFAARARAASHELDMASLPRSSSLESHESRQELDQQERQRESHYRLEMALLEEGNARLARIRRLPVTAVLRFVFVVPLCCRH